MGSNIAGIVPASAARHAGRTALRLGDAEISYASLDDAVAQVAGLLRERGVGAGDRVAVMLPNLPPFAFAYYGALRLGAVVQPMNVLLKRREVSFLLNDAGAKVIFAFEGLHEHAAAGAATTGAQLILVAFDGFDAVLEQADPVTEVVSRRGDDTAVLLYTSGTTGSPKGAELTHDNLRRNFEISAGLFDIGPDDVTLGVLPLFHSFGQTCGLNTAISSGACLTLLPRFDPGQALEMLEAHRVTICEGVPTMYAAMVDHPDAQVRDFSRLKVCISGGSAMPVAVLHACEERFSCPLLEGYGLSETSPVASFNQPGLVRKPGSIGTPIEDVEMRVVDEHDREVLVGEVGEILIRGHNVMKGYWHEPQASAHELRGGWMHTGDLARVDEDGYYFIVDRKKDMIIRGGLNVYPREVEEVLYEHPAVSEAAVVAVPHALLGEDVGAAVVLKAGAQVSERELRTFVRDQIAVYKHPRHLWFVEELPKGPTGKILKRSIDVPDILATPTRRSPAP
ncbi:MAG: long-chain fatty acid--CoA ligase [Solirubrobacterales bacterium]|jgi:long-chain acyl-CoA synthetase|nr:long-chain fatty acid--CoA ligase [Solirubrobacterales bacterium]